jgi:hypothetical protein
MCGRKDRSGGFGIVFVEVFISKGFSFKKVDEYLKVIQSHTKRKISEHLFSITFKKELKSR